MGASQPVWALALGAGLVVAAGVWLQSRPQRGLLVLAALLPFDGLLTLVPGGARLGGWKEALLLLVLVCSVTAPPGARRPRDASGATTRLPGWAWAAVALVLLSLGSAVAVGGVVGLWGLKVGCFYALVAVVLYRCPFDARERDRLVTILMVTGALCAVVGLAQQVVGPERLHAWGYEYNETIRFSGGLFRSFSTFAQPFGFGLYLCLVLLVCTPVALRAPRRARNAVFLALAPVLVLGMGTSVVRGAFLGLAAGLVLLTVWRHRALLHVGVVAAAGLLFVPAGIVAAFVSQDSLAERTTGWADVWDLALRSPVGNGIGRTGAAAEKALAVGAPPDAVISLGGQRYQPDNQYVKTVLELGPVGLWLLVLLLVAAVVGAMACARRVDGPDRGLAEGLAASLVGVMAASLVATYLEVFPLDFYFWLGLGTLLSLDAPVGRAATDGVPPRATTAVGG